MTAENLTESHSENDLQIDRYLNNQMNAEEQTAFEIRLLGDPVLLEQLQLAEAFKQGLKEELKEELNGGLNREQQTLKSDPGRAKVVSIAAWFRQPLSMAASVLIAIMGLQMGLGLFPDSAPEGIRTLPIRSQVVLEGSRGSSSETLIGAGPYLFQIDAGPGTLADAFTLTFQDTVTGEILIQQHQLQPDQDGWIRLVVNEALPDTVQVALGWQDAEGNARASLYQLKVSP